MKTAAGSPEYGGELEGIHTLRSKVTRLPFTLDPEKVIAYDQSLFKFDILILRERF